jgi:predicted aldo/keto reductase-like oxidoreductase
VKGALATAAVMGVQRSALASVGEIPRRPLGRTGELVSAIGVGGFHLSVPSERDAITIVRRAIDSGITFLDNCWDYADGKSEERAGKALRDGYRHRAFLMTKIDGRTAKSAMKQLEESLSRLQTDHVDLIQFHEIIRMSDPALIFAPGGALEAVVKAQQQGKVRFIGFTGHKSPAIHQLMLDQAAKHRFRFDAVQMPLNVMDAHHDSFEKRILPRLVKDEVAVLGMKPLGSPFILDSKTVSARECLKYAMSLPVSVTITGIDSFEILDQAIDVARGFKPLSADARAAILSRTEKAARGGTFEKYKSTDVFDGTSRNPAWLG